MKRAICDVCHSQGPLEDPYGSLPKTWYRLSRGYLAEKHLCSVSCLDAAVKAEIDRVALTLPEAEAPVNA